MSTTFHPQMNGQTERINLILEQYFRSFAGNNKYKWIELLPTTQMAINKSYNENLKQFPALTFATKMKNNWAAIGTKITKTRQKVKKNWMQKKTLSRSNQGTKHFYRQKI